MSILAHAQYELAEANARIEELKAEVADARGERDAYMKSYEAVCQRRDELEAALEAEKRATDAAHAEALRLERLMPRPRAC